MNYAATVPQIESEFFDERGLPITYNPPPVQQTGSMNILRKVQNNIIPISEEGEEIQLIQQSNAPSIPGSVPGSVSDSVPALDFPFLEFPLTEVVSQSQINF